MTHYMLYRLGLKKDLGVFLEGQVPGQWSAAWLGKVGPKGWMSVQAAVTAVMRNERLSELLKDCIAFSGDVDTVATIARLASGLVQLPEYEQDLPQDPRPDVGEWAVRPRLPQRIELDRKLLALPEVDMATRPDDGDDPIVVTGPGHHCID